MKLKDVFINDFPRASHQPATFCPFPHLLLVPVNAFFILLFCIVADKKEFVKYKSSVFPSVFFRPSSDSQRGSAAYISFEGTLPLREKQQRY